MIISRDKSLLCPVFANQILILEARLKNAALPFALFMAFRDWQTQDELYAQGRTKPGNIVTNAKGGDSWHNYGLAVDFVLDSMPDLPGLQWSWDAKADINHDGINDWKQMAKIAVELGLESGFYWKKFPDLPHVQNRFGMNLSDAKELYRTGGIKAVWAECRL
jgi:peptidoglycan LD-endopeptidase CwlK